MDRVPSLKVLIYSLRYCTPVPFSKRSAHLQKRLAYWTLPSLGYQRCSQRYSVRWIAFVQLLDIAFFNLLHEFPAPEEVGAQAVGELARHNEEMVVNCLRQRGGAAGGNEMRTPLKHEPSVPENEKSEHRRNCREGGRARAKHFCGAMKEEAQTHDEERNERNEQAVAEGRDSRPIGIAGDENVESEKGGEERNADGRFATGKKKEANDREQKNRRPKKQAVIRREKYLEQ